ncbi:hypothetical protein ACFFX1_05865 [Dactylosporangium sucinum]|uniref:Uncharacterized protein n=1 Tax=Dactylosporangium sucinum TaxID=1424081 RepID=A0A917UH71_9ACTN|nr:hypothetical protein [Dactylosporangium sucinum]GGM87278.1 hypothetical protein GCM10007977_106540 [Dactylosporangium sucinum]
MTHRPSLTTRLHAAAAGERGTAALEALRTAGKAAYDELLQADRLRDEQIVAEISPWAAPPGVGSQLLAAWNAFVLQTLGEALLDADYATDHRTVGFVPPATYEHAFACLSAVAEWIDRARQARVDPGYDLAAQLDLPAQLPDWVGSPGQSDALVLAVSSLRGHIDLALHGLEQVTVPAEHAADLTRLKQTATQAASAADYATSLHSSGDNPSLAEVIRHNLAQAVRLWFEVGQLAAMPRLLTMRPADQAAAHPPAQAARPPGKQTVRPTEHAANRLADQAADRASKQTAAPRIVPKFAPKDEPISTAARLDLAAELVRAAGRAGADNRIDPVVSAKWGGIEIQVPSSDTSVQARLTLVAVYARVLGVEPIAEQPDDGDGSYWFKAKGRFNNCKVEAWAHVDGAEADA